MIDRPRIGWSGYLPVGEAWLTLAVAGADERALTERCLRASFGLSLRDLAHSDASIVDRVADTLQTWGIAAFSARPPADKPEHRNVPIRGGRPAALIDVLLQAGFRGSDALSGTLVVDCGQLVAAPWASALLRAWGATVIGVSHPARAGSRRYGEAPLLLDLNGADARNRFARLCARADLVIDNFRAHVWEGLGLDPLTLGTALHVRVPAFPSEHPDRGLKAYGFQLEARYRVGHAPMRPGARPVTAGSQALLDHSVGMAAAAACARALLAGRVGPLEISQLDLIEEVVA